MSTDSDQPSQPPAIPFGWPTGTVAFLFTDVERSTLLWEQHPTTMPDAIGDHLNLLRAAVASHGGVLYKVVGDGTQSAFPTPQDALRAATAAQHEMAARIKDAGELRLWTRMAIHVGEAIPQGNDYLAAPLNRLSRLLAAGHGGQILLTGVARSVIGSSLPDGVSIASLGRHRLRDLSEVDEIFEARGAWLPRPLPPLRTGAREYPPLPMPLTPLIGRSDEEKYLEDAYSDGSARLVTITGPGGVGKTRLALQVAVNLSDAYLGHVAFVDLAPLTSPELVIPTICSVLGLPANHDQPWFDLLEDHFQSHRALLVLDNLERVIDAAPELVNLIGACPSLCLLITSREPLNVRGEQEFRLSPLAIPVPERQVSPEAMADVPAIALFVDRARGADPQFSINEKNAQAISEICCRLEGLPLALELAAARIRTLTPQELLDRLSRQLPILRSSSRDLPQRQRTMRDTIAWSFDLLEAQEQAALCDLAVASGGFTLELADALIGEEPKEAVLDIVTSLVERSLLRRIVTADAHVRFAALEVVREFVLEQAAESARGAAMTRHARFFTEQAGVLERGPRSLGIQALHGPLAQERDNVRQALTWLAETGDADRLTRLAAATYALWLAWGLPGEGLAWIERGLHEAPGMPNSERIEAIDAAGNLAIFSGDLALASTLIAEGLDLAKKVGEPFLIGQSLNAIAQLAYRRGNASEAESWLREASAVLSSGENPPSRALRGELGITRLLRGDVAMTNAAFEEARTQYLDALERFRALEFDWEANDAQAGLAGAELGLGRHAEAAELYRHCLATAWEHRQSTLLPSPLLGFAALAAIAGDGGLAAQLLGAASAAAKSAGVPVFQRDQPGLQDTQEQARRLTGHTDFEHAYQTGLVTPLGTSVATALSFTVESVMATG